MVRTLKLVVVGLGLVAGTLLAQDRGEGRAPRDRQRRERPAGAVEGPRGPRMSVDQQMERLNKELTLSTEQQEKIRKLLNDHREKMMEQMRSRMQDNREKMDELRKEIEEARKANDAAKLKELEARRRELWGGADMAESRQKLISDIEGTLTAEQKAKFKKIQDEVFPGRGGPVSLESDPRMLMAAVRSLDLPREKGEKMRELFREWGEKSKDVKDADERRKMAADLYEKVMKELNDEQKAKLKEWRPGPGAGRGGERPAGPEGRERGRGGRAGRGARGAGGGGQPAQQ